MFFSLTHLATTVEDLQVLIHVATPNLVIPVLQQRKVQAYGNSNLQAS